MYNGNPYVCIIQGDDMEFGKGKIKEYYVVHLDMGEDVLLSLEEFIKQHNIKNGVIVAGYGTLDKVRYHVITTNGLPPKDKFIEFEAPLELISVDGIIANGEIHAHMTVSDGNQTWGGHLEPGSRTLYLCDFVIAGMDEIDMGFKINPKNNLKLLTFNNENSDN